MTMLDIAYGFALGIALGTIFTTAVYYFLFDSFKNKMTEIVTMYETLKG